MQTVLDVWKPRLLPANSSFSARFIVANYFNVLLSTKINFQTIRNFWGANINMFLEGLDRKIN